MILRRPQWPPKTKAAFVSLLAAGTRLSHLAQLHALLLTTGLFFAKNAALPTRLFFALCDAGHLPHAHRLFETMPIRRPRHWRFLSNSLVRSYVDHGQCPHSFALFRGMLRWGLVLDKFTLPPLLRGCANISDPLFGTSLHALAVKNGVHCDVVTGTELAVMYVKVGEASSAERSLGEIRDKDLMAWNAVLSALLQCGSADRVLHLACRMEAEGMECDAVTLVSIISACGYLGCLGIGKNLHGWIQEQSAGMVNIFVQNALIDMYANCGSMEAAKELFEDMELRNVVSWSCMISGYAMNGDSRMALELFSQMEKEGMHPNEVTYLAVLTACGHTGMVDEGRCYFRRIRSPGIEHYAAMVDILGRSGHLEEAYEFIKGMPIEPDAGVWGALLASCAIYRNTEVGQVAADHVVNLAIDTPSYQVLLSNIYAACGRWDDVEKARRRLRRLRGHGVQKIASYSSIELDGLVHMFYQGSYGSCSSTQKALSWLNGVVRAMGYSPVVTAVLHDVEPEDKDAASRDHSEKIALAFHLSRCTSPEFAVIRIMKNLRICDDCHCFFKYASAALGRQIVVRDKRRFHHFRDGRCSCGDFW